MNGSVFPNSWNKVGTKLEQSWNKVGTKLESSRAKKNLKPGVKTSGNGGRFYEK